LQIYHKILIGDILIDDHAKGKGQDKFKGKLILFGSLKYPNCSYILDSFREVAKI